MSLSALAPVVIFPCNPGGFQVIDYHGRSSAAIQAASQRLLLPLPVDTASLSRLEAGPCLVESLETFGGERHAPLPALHPGAGLLQLSRDRACVQLMHGELQPSSVASLRKLPSCDVTKRLVLPPSLAAFRLAPEAYIAFRQPVRSHRLSTDLKVTSFYSCSNLSVPPWGDLGARAGGASLLGVY